ncbi:MAG: terminase small subunit [Candidatus Binataceae bacterium]
MATSGQIKKRLREDRFIAEYLKDLNGTQAVIRMGEQVTDPSQAAGRFMRSHRVRDMIERRNREIADAAHVTAERIVQEAARLAFSDVRELLQADGTIKPIGSLSDNAAASISDLEYENVVVGTGDDAQIVSRVKKIKRWNKNESLQLLARVRGMVHTEELKPVSVFNIQINV